LDSLSKITEANGEKLEFINKRVDIVQTKYYRLKILAPLYEKDARSAKDSDIINKAVEYFYKSDEVIKKPAEV